MAEALFLNPMGRNRKMAKRKTRKRASPAQASFRKLVKSYGGDMRAAAKKWRQMKAKRRGVGVGRGKAIGRGRKTIRVSRISPARVHVRATGIRGIKEKLRVKKVGRAAATITARNPYRRRVGVPSRYYAKRRRRRSNVSVGAVGRRAYRRPFGAVGVRNPRAGGPSAWADEYYRSLGRARRRSGTAGSRRRGRNPVAKKRRRRRSRNQISPRRARALAKRRRRDTKGRFRKGAVAKRRRTRRRGAGRRRNPLWRTRKGRFTGRKTARRANRVRRVRRKRRRSNLISAPQARALTKYRRRSKRGRFRKGLAKGWKATRSLGFKRRRPSRRTYKRAANRRRRYYGRRRNPLALKQTTMQLVSMPSLIDYSYIGGGFIAGAILPRFVAKALDKVGVTARIPPMALEVGVGIVSTIGAGVVTGLVTKDRRRAVQVAGGALVGALGSLALSAIEKYIPMSGFGNAAADAAVRAAVAEEVKKNLGLSQFLTEASVEDDLSMEGFGDFVTAGEVEEAGTVSGVFGAEADEDVVEAAEFEYEAD